MAWKKVAFSEDCIPKSLLTTTGDMLYASDVGVPERRAAVDDGDILTLVLGIPQWDPPAAPAVHAINHKSGGSDPLLLSDLIAAGTVAFVGKEAKNLKVHTSSTPPSDVVGKWYFDAEDLALYICTTL